MRISHIYTSQSTEEQVNFLCNAMMMHCHVTQGHLQRASDYAVALGQIKGLEPRDLETLRVGAKLHDIGKLFVPQTILIKPERLTANEFAQVRRHPVAGAEWLTGLHWTHEILSTIRHHHSQWDGKGYPASVRGYDIPLSARICAVVDAYDACRADRYYRKGMSRREAVQVLIKGSGAYYDPELVTLFINYLKTNADAGSERILTLQQPFNERMFDSESPPAAAEPQRGLLDSDLSRDQ